MNEDFRTVLVLGGGNALGAYHAGVYQALHEQGIEPDWILGASIGAITGAIIGGNKREDRLDRLQHLWGIANPMVAWFKPFAMMPDVWRRTTSALVFMIAGKPGIFAPVGPLGSWWFWNPNAATPALYNTQMLRDTLERLVDFGRLNDGAARYTAMSVDLETGEEVAFDTSRENVGVDHVRASAALLPAFPSVEVDGRLLVDGGLSQNVPIDPVLADPGERPVLCFAADLLPLEQARPATLGEAVGRMQDLMFAAQTRRSIERWQAVYDAQREAEPGRSVTLVKLDYSDQGQEVAGKAMDFSPSTVRQRWAAGYKDANEALRRVRSGEITTGAPGLTVVET